MKVICPNCGKVIDVKDDDVMSYCKHCSDKFNTQDAITATLKRYKFLQDDARKKLFDSLDFATSYKEYEMCLELRPNDISSISGMAMTKVIGSTFDNFKYIEVKNLFDKYNIVLNKENTFLLLNFIKDFLKYVKAYYREADSRLKENDVFLNYNYLDLYIKNNNDIIEVLDFFKESLTLVEQEEFNDFINDVDKDFEENFKKQYERAYKNKTLEYKVNNLGTYNYSLELLNEDKVTTSSDSIEDMRIFLPDEKFLKLRKWMSFTLIICAFVIVAIIIVALIIKVTWVYALVAVPALIGLTTFAAYYKKTK